MKKPLCALALLCSFAFTMQAHADDYGCQVLMCLSNPQGPMAVQQCVPPIQRFIDSQNKPHPDPFPTCEEGAPATMTQTMRTYDFCPDGTSALGQDVNAIQLTPAIFNQLADQAKALASKPSLGLNLIAVPPGVVVQTGIGEGDQQHDPQVNKVCVAKQLGTLAFSVSSPDGPTAMSAEIYEQVATMAPATQPRVVDVFIGQKLYRSVRY